MPDKFDLSSIKNALEHATFRDFEIRDALNAALKSIELDLDEIGFEQSENTKEALEILDATILDSEAPSRKNNYVGDYHVEDSEEETPVVNDDEVIEQTSRPVVNVDEELDELENGG